MTTRLDKNLQKLKLSKFNKVTVDINVELLDALTAEEQNFYTNLLNFDLKYLTKEQIAAKKKEGRDRQDAFLHMAKAEQQTLMKGGLDPKEEALIWEHGSKLALRYINKSYLLKDQIEKIPKLAKICFVIACVCFGADMFFNVYAKNKQLHVETFSGKVKYELIPAAMQSINNHKQNIQSSENLMSVDAYKAYISKAGFSCGTLNSIVDGFHQTNGKPLCAEGEDGDIFVAGYVVNPTFPQPVFNVVHKGVIYNYDLNNDAGLTVAELPGLTRVSFANVPYTFSRAFPDAVRVAQADVITKDKENKE